MCLVKSLYGLWRVPLLVTVMLYGCSTDLSPDRSPKTQKQPVFEQKGKASWYGPGFHGKETASGETYNQNELTAAHRTLPLGTEVEVTNLKSGKSVKVEINDRGPYVGNRVIDLSRAAAKEIGMKEKGLATVKIEADSVRKKAGDATAQNTKSKDREKKKIARN
jgi:rare lipoprotein A